MPRAHNPPKAARGKSKKEFNAAGYNKRKSQKSKPATNLDDVYEYQPERVRRAKVKLQLERDEAMGAGGVDGSDDDEMDGRSKRPRLVGEADDDEIGEDEDEEIDSDAAFEESDEERYAGFSFASDKKLRSSKKLGKAVTKKSKDVHLAEVDLNEDTDMEDDEDDAESVSEDANTDEEEEEGEPDEFIDVLDILDGRADPETGEEPGKSESQRQATTARKDEVVEEKTERDHAESENEDSEDEEEEDDDDSEEHSDMEPDEEVEAAESALNHLESFISNLDAGTKRKTPEDGGEDRSEETRKRKRRMLKEQTQSGLESEFAAQTGSCKLSLDDLLAPLASSSSNLQSLKKSAKVLASTSSKAQTLAAPLPQRAQERLDREAAYEQTKEEIDKWSATMKRIKEAEHLSFPLQAESSSKPSNLELMAKFKPTTEMESAVDRLLKSAKMREQDIAQTEALKMNHLSVEEVAERRAELAKMRELMFRAEAKAKRVAKIKSKTYRRIKKKEKAKLAAKLGELEDDADDEESQLKREVERARERATLRHKNTGKWAKAMKGRGELDEDQRREINEMLDRGEKLRRRIEGRGSGDDSDSDGDDDDSEDGENAVERIKSRAFDELKRLDTADVDGEDASGGKKAKSVFEMKFMKDAMTRDKLRAEQIADDFIREMGGRIPNEDEDEVAHDAPEGASAGVERVGGRMSFRPGNMAEKIQTFPSMASDTSSVTLKSTDLLSNHPETSAATSPILERPPTSSNELQNPWLAVSDDAPSRAAQKKHEVAVGKTSAGAEKSKAKLRKRVKKREEEREKAREEAAVEISMGNVLTSAKTSASAEAGPSSEKKAAASQPSKPTAAAAGEDDDDDDVHSEVEEQERAERGKGKGKAKGVKAFEQRDLVARAFAGDNVVQEFAEAKRHEIQADAPKEVDTTLPGWGSWGGRGAKKAPPKPYLVKKVAGVDPRTRADYGKAHVIISEKRDKKAAKYLVKDLPYPYTSRAQFERSMDTPVGTEWNTRVGFQRGTLPQVTKKMGTVITPLEKLF